MLQKLNYAVHDIVPSDLAAIVDAGLEGANARFAPLGDVEPLACSARLPDDRVIGGAIGRTWGLCAELQQVWVDPDYRRRGIARRLIGDFEMKAMSRGCETVFLETFSFQCPDLYLKLGYEICCTISGFAPGVEKYTMTRSVGRLES